MVAIVVLKASFTVSVKSALVIEEKDTVEVTKYLVTTKGVGAGVGGAVGGVGESPEPEE